LRITAEDGQEGLPCQDSSQQAHRRTGTGTVQDIGWLTKTAQTLAMDSQRRGTPLFNLNAQSAYGVQRCLAISRW
jgi:hypothetical protein